jgi:hypothetical protein
MGPDEDAKNGDTYKEYMSPSGRIRRLFSCPAPVLIGRQKGDMYFRYVSPFFARESRGFGLEMV